MNDDSFEYRFLDIDKQEFVRTEIELVERFRDCGSQRMIRAISDMQLNRMVIAASANHFTELTALVILINLENSSQLLHVEKEEH